MIVVVHFTTCCLCQQVTNLVVLGTRYLRSRKSLPPPPWSCFPCHRCPGRPPGEVRRSEGAAFLLNLPASCSSLSCLINFSLKLASLPLQVLPPQPQSQQGPPALPSPPQLLVKSSSLPDRQSSNLTDSRSRRRRSAWRSEPRILSIPAVCSPSFLERGWLGCWRSL